MRLPDEIVERLLDAWPVARLATVDPAGAPHLVPVVFARSGGRLWSPIDAKPKTGAPLARLRNVRGEPRVGLLLDEYGPDWTRLWWLRVDGEAEVVEPGGTAPVAAAVAALRRKYPQYERSTVLPDPPTLIAVRATSFRGWCAGPEALAHLRTQPPLC